MQIVNCQLFILRCQFIIPAHYSIVIMCARIYHTVSFVIVRQIVTFFPGVKSKLQHLHARIAAFLQHPSHAVCQKAEIFCNDRQIAKLLSDRTKQIHSRTLLPFPFLAVFSP